MAVAKKMDSRELGLVLTEILLDAKDLHYGLWDDDLPLTIGNARIAQQRYTDKLLAALPAIKDDATPVHILDVGCGAGHMMTQMLEKGYYADGVSPADGLTQRVKERIASYPVERTRVFECRFEKFPEDQCRNQYDAVMFSESFQYIKLNQVFIKLQQLVKPGGIVIISDFFKTPADGDGGPGDQSMRGGHHLTQFYDVLRQQPFKIEMDQDITRQVSPNLELVNDLLMNKIKPAGSVLGQYLSGRYPKAVALIKLLKPFYRKTQDKIHFKYFSGNRSKAVFERYKSYRFIILRYEG